MYYSPLLENLIAISDNVTDSTSKPFMKKVKKALFLKVFELENSSLSEQCPTTEIFLASIFSYLDRMQRFNP